MPILIDGYNLLHETGILGRQRGGRSLEQSRQVLIVFLKQHFSADQEPITVVFDAAAALPGLPTTEQYGFITVHYAADHDDADDMIEELIRAESVPRKLVVVSSDHRIQRAARRRRATAVDSEVWYDQVIEGRQRSKQTPTESAEPPSVKPTEPLSPDEIARWMDEFGV